MKTPITLLLAAICCTASHAQSPGYRSHFSFSSSDMVQGLRSAVLHDGALVQAAVNLSNDGTSALTVIVTEANGTGRAATSYPLPDGYPMMSDLAITADGGFLVLYAGSTTPSQSYLAARFDQQGDLQWARRIQPPGVDQFEYGYSKCYELPNGHLRLSLSLSTQMVLCELDAEGTVLWGRTYSGQVFINDGDTMMGKNPSFAAAATADGGAIITGKRESDGFLVRCDATGSPVWSLAFPNGEYTHIRAIERLSDGAYAIAGFRGSHSFLSKIDENGDVIWSKSYVDQDFWLFGVGFETIHELENGDLVVISPPGGTVSILLRTDASGNPIDAYRSRMNYMLYDLRLIEAANGQLRMCGVISDYTDYTTRLIEGRMNVGSMEDCEFLPLQVVAFDEAPITPEEVDAYSVALNISSVPVTLVPNAITGEDEDVCAMLVGIEEPAKEQVVLSPSIVEAGEVIRVTGLGDGRHTLVIHDAAGALVSSTSITENGTLGTQGFAAGIYTMRFLDVSRAKVPLRFVVR